MTSKLPAILRDNNNLIIKKSKIILSEAVSRLSNDEVKLFEDNYINLLIQYYKDNDLRASGKFDISSLTDFCLWKEHLVSQKDKYIILIVGKMMMGDILAHAIYKELYDTLQREDLILNGEAQLELNWEGMDNNEIEAVLNAEYWLSSNEAKNILCISDNYNAELEELVGNCNSYHLGL